MNKKIEPETGEQRDVDRIGNIGPKIPSGNKENASILIRNWDQFIRWLYWRTHKTILPTIIQENPSADVDWSVK